MAFTLGFRLTLLAVFLSLAQAAKFVEDTSGFNYDRNGDDWGGLCQTGKEQSPVNIETEDNVELDEPKLQLDIEDLGEVEGLISFSTGAAVEVKWKNFTREPVIKVAAHEGDIYAIFSEDGTELLESEDIEMLDVVPIQFHFHAPSENAIDGRLAPFCVHIVNKVKEGQSEACDKETCLVVLGVHFEYGAMPTEANEVLAPLFAEMPTEVGEENGVAIDGTFDLMSLLPDNREHFTWKGSLTTPPCTEGVLWVLFTEPLTISTSQVNAHQQVAAFAAGPDCANITEAGECDPPRQLLNHRPVQELNGRVIRKAEE